MTYGKWSVQANKHTHTQAHVTLVWACSGLPQLYCGFVWFASLLVWTSAICCACKMKLDWVKWLRLGGIISPEWVTLSFCSSSLAPESGLECISTCTLAPKSDHVQCLSHDCDVIQPVLAPSLIMCTDCHMTVTSNGNTELLVSSVLHCTNEATITSYVKYLEAWLTATNVRETDIRFLHWKFCTEENIESLPNHILYMQSAKTHYLWHASGLRSPLQRHQQCHLTIGLPL